MSEAKYIVSSTPHVRDNSTTQKIMADVVIALTPAALMGIYYFGVDALITIVASIAACVFFEYGFQKLMKRTIAISDLSAVVTGLLLALNLPASKNIGIPIAGAFFAIVIIKQLYGGIGSNFINPALGARAFLLLSYPTHMVTYPAPLRNLFGLGVNVVSRGTDVVSSATPLANLKNGIMPVAADYLNAFIGYTGGCIGETCAVALLLGGLYLLFKKVINFRIPLAYILTTAVLTGVLGRNGFFNGAPIYELLTGGLLIGAFFMATDYTTSPVTPNGQIIMGIGCGVLTAVIRIYGGYPEGVSYSILLMNLTTPLIDQFTKPRVFGVKKAKIKLT